jgi:hypothetical protein
MSVLPIRNRYSANAATVRGSDTLHTPKPTSQKRRAQTSVIRSNGRGQVDVPQGAHVIHTILRKDELPFRNIESAGGQKPMFAPPATSDDVFNVRKGQLIMHRAAPNRQTRGALGENTMLEAIAVVNGLSRDTKLFMPGVNLVTREATDKNSDNHGTVQISGIQTVVHCGHEELHPGDLWAVDPDPLILEDENGQMRPGVEVVGIPSNSYVFQIRPVRANTFHSQKAALREDMRTAMSKQPFKDELARVHDHRSLLLLLRKLHHDVMLYSKVNDAQPIWAYMRLWLASYVVLLVQLEELRPITNPAQFEFWALQALRAELLDAETRFTAIVTDYDSSLPHDTAPRKPYVALGGPCNQLHNVRSNKLAEQLDSDRFSKLDPVDKAYTLREVRARLGAIAKEYEEVLMWEQRSWMGRHIGGTVLSSSGAGKPLHVLLGRVY